MVAANGKQTEPPSATQKFPCASNTPPKTATHDLDKTISERPHPGKARVMVSTQGANRRARWKLAVYGRSTLRPSLPGPKYCKNTRNSVQNLRPAMPVTTGNAISKTPRAQFNARLGRTTADTKFSLPIMNVVASENCLALTTYRFGPHCQKSCPSSKPPREFAWMADIKFMPQHTVARAAMQIG